MATPGGGGGALYYNPEPYERAYYDGLFTAADSRGAGAIGGQEAVAFFSRSKLPMEQLKNVWTVADNPPTNSLNRQKFAVAIRLIQLLQNGVKGQGANLGVPPGTPLRPVYLEGISGAVVPMPGQGQNPQQQQQQQRPPSGQGVQPGQGPPQLMPHQQQQQQPASPSPVSHRQQQQPPSQMNNGGKTQMDPPNSPGAGNMALTVQDPYTLIPTERARYESIFPQYAQDDGYMHGREAVQLFSKSGLNQSQLRDIWNMVDQPVDNKLDKLEFAMAMHLIVCVSKKNLPMPKALPFSLKTLKQQQQSSEPQGQQQQQQQQPPSMAPSYESQQRPLLPQQQQPPLPQPPQQQQPSPLSIPEPSGMPGMAGMGQSNMHGPPPLSQPGGMGISDAFEGLGAAASGGDGMGGLPPPTSGFGSLGTGVGAEASYGGYGSSSPKQEPAPAPSAPSPTRGFSYEAPQAMSSTVSTPAPKTAEALANSYSMSDSNGELVKLKTVLQKLQAENISLKAQLGTMSEDEKDVQRQISATVAEIGELSNHLTNLRAQVLAAKSRLMEATVELKAAQEKKGVLKDLIGEAQATKEAIDSAYQGIEASAHVAQAAAPAPAFEEDLFGFGAPPAAPPKVPQAPALAANSQQPQAYGAAPAPFPAPGPAPMPYGQQEQSGAPAPFSYGQPQQGGAPQIETVSGSSDEEQEDDGDDQGELEHQEDMFGFNEPPANQYHHQQPESSSGTHENYGYDPNNAHQGISFEQNFRPNPPDHNRQSSISSNLSFEVMGGAPIPQMSHPQGDDHDLGDDEQVMMAASMEEIAELKMKAKDAEDLARDSEETLRQLMEKADRLRRAADQAEVEARQKTAEATEKKKGGFMGGGKKKKSLKEATQAKQDAEAKKKEFLDAQSQANDAQAVAMETKREAEKLRKMAEQAELDAAAAASMQQKQPEPEPAPAPQQLPAHNYQHSGQQNFGPPQGYGQPQGYGAPPNGPPQSYGGGYGQHSPPPSYGQYNPSVMGPPQGGGIELPSPSAGGGDPYANPF